MNLEQLGVMFLACRDGVISLESGLPLGETQEGPWSSENLVRIQHCDTWLGREQFGSQFWESSLFLGLCSHSSFERLN